MTPKQGENAGTADANFRLLLDRITDGFIALDKNFCYLYVNQKIGELLHRSPQSLIGKNVWQEFPDAVGSFTYRSFYTAMKEQRFISNVDYYPPLDLWQENYIYPSPEGLSVFIKDITERKKIELAMQEQQRQLQLQTLAAALEAQEKERTHIGRELHDNINQILTATRLLLAMACDQPAEAPALMVRCMNQLDKAINENRALAHELVAPRFDGQGFADEIASLLRCMTEPKKITTEMDAGDFDEDRLTEKQKLALYRIVQEQCTNVIKHAGATVLRLQMHTSQTLCTVVIADNGKGNGGSTAKGIGLRNIESRLQLFGGTLDVVNRPGSGFALHIGFPLV